MQQKLDIAKKIITDVIIENNLQLIKIILFGSRARWDYKKESDYDFFVVINKDLSFPEKSEINTQIRRRLAENNISADIIMQSEKKLEERKNNVGYLSNYVIKKGIPL